MSEISRLPFYLSNLLVFIKYPTTQKLFVKISTTLPANPLREMKLWSKAEIVAGEFLLSFGQCRN